MEQSISLEDGQRPITKACDVCRKKKIRCEPTLEGCAQCTRFKTHCHFTPIGKKKKHRHPPGHKEIAKLEERLKTMESLLNDALGKNKVHESGSPFHDHTQDGKYILETAERRKNFSESQDSLVMTSRFEQPEKYFPNSSHVAELTLGDFAPSSTVFMDQTALFPLYACHSWKGAPALGPFSLPHVHQLPPQSVALELIDEAFTSYNNFFPLFNKDDFLAQFDQNYLVSSPSDPAWWACINVVLALAHRFRGMRDLNNIVYENVQSCGHMHNALAVVSELNIVQNSLSAVQALVGMALILRSTPNPHSSSVLIAAAVRLGQAMGLHRKTDGQIPGEESHEQRRRVFWIAYFLDKDISLRTSQPFAQDDGDMDADLPSEALLDVPPYRNGNCGSLTFNIFNSRIGLAIIQGQIYKKLYSVQASQQSGLQRAIVAQELNTLLSYWRSSVPIDIEYTAPPHNILTAEMIHMLVLRFTYVNCLIMIDRHLPPPEQLLTGPAFEVQEGDPLAMQESICINESRKALSLIEVTPRGDYALVWVLLHPVFEAVVALLNNVLRHPVSPEARSDIRITTPFLQLLETLAAENRTCSKSDEARRMREICNDLTRRAKLAVESTDLMAHFE